MFPLVVGLGSSHGDDQAGWLMIEHLWNLGFPKDQSRKLRHPVDLLDDMTSTTPVWICDACQTSESVGTVQHWVWPTDQFSSLKSAGTHDLSLPDVLKLAQTLSRCPARMEIWGINGVRWSPGDTPDPTVLSAAQRVAEAIWNRCQA